MRKKIQGHLALILMACILVVSSTAAAERSDWREMAVGHFELFSTLTDSGTRSVARQLQAFEETLGVWLQTGDRLPDTPTRIYLLSYSDFNKYAAPRSGLGGFFQEGRFGNIMVVNAAEDFEVVRVTMFHEFVHYIQRNTGTQTYPPWYTEGYAELFSGFKLSNDKVVIGGLPTGTALRSKWIPVERLLAVKQTDPEYQTERLAPQFYGECWALVHLLLFDDKSLNAPTFKYLGNLNAGFPEPEAFATAFSFDKAELDTRLRKFIEGGRILAKVATLRDAVVVDQAPLTRLTPARADAEFYRLIWELDKPKSIVDALAPKAAAEAIGDRSVRALVARIAAHQGEPMAIDDLAASLAKGGINESQERIDVADALLYSNSGDPANRQALAILGDLVQVNGAPVEAVELWASAASRAGVSTSQIVAALEPLLVRVPHDTAVLQSLARAYEVMGDKAKSRDAYNQIILVSPSPEERHWAQQQADSARLQVSPPQASR
jgi:hypothetical protein